MTTTKRPRSTNLDFKPMFDVLRDRLMPVFEPGIVNGVIDELFFEGPGPPPRQRLTANQEFWYRWQDEFSEILESVFHLEAATRYLARCPPRTAKAQWLRYHFEAYIQGVYIVQLRVLHFLKMLRKLAVRSSARSAISLADKLTQRVEATLKPLILLRGKHVHERMHRHPDVHALDGMFVFLHMPVLRALRPMAHERFRRVSSKIARQFRRNNKIIGELCGDVLRQALPLLIDMEPPRVRTVSA
jgi:hypothetical protein